jgi:hypothetical protein
MTMRRVLIGLALLAGTVLAQTAMDPNERVQKLIVVKYVDPNALQMLLMNFGVEMRADQRLRTVALSGRRSAVMTAEEAIKQLDVPGAAQKDIELTVYFVVGADVQEPGTPAIPQDIQGTVATLKSTFPFKNYYLLDTLGLRSRSGVGADAGGQLSGGRFTSFRVGSVTVEPDGTMIRLDRLHAGLRIPHQGADGKLTYIDTGVTTEVVDVKEGQKLVVGRSSLDGPGKALFLVLIAKIVQ